MQPYLIIIFLKKDYVKCIEEMETVIAERPYYDVPYKDLITKLVDGEQVRRCRNFS